LATPIPVNHARFTLGELVAATGGRLVELAADAAVEGVSTDSRTLAARQLFVAVRGESHDGHRFVEEARGRGAVVLVAADAAVAGARLEVDGDTLTALGAIARAHVDRLALRHGARPTLAIGGAAGKTTTKTLAAAAVGALFGETLVTAGNLNNRIGVPMTLLTLEPRHRALVLECGTSVRGEIAALGAVVRPDVAVVTNVGIEHSAGLGSLEEIADEEAGLLRAARRVAITSADETLLVERLASVAAIEKLTFGISSASDVRVGERASTPEGKTKTRIRLGERLAGVGGGAVSVEVISTLVGPAAATNLAAALGGALALLGRPATSDELVAACDALGAVEAVPGRLCPRRIGDLLVLDDSYNSNPKSVPAALVAARELAEARRGRLVIALGDMLELGDLAPAEHDTMLRAADATAAAHLILIGPESRSAAKRTRLATPTSLFADSAAAAEEIAALVAPGDVLLVKGSRGIRTERLIEALAANDSRA
jgi:UDP-N-acetylmuramoyl-tripeptide--D-alanyl-D-alanine ligase